MSVDILGTSRVTNAEAWFNIALRPRKPDGSPRTDSPETATSTLTQLLNYYVERGSKQTLDVGSHTRGMYKFGCVHRQSPARVVSHGNDTDWSDPAAD